MWYYGVRYKRACTPTDLWKVYFTSSKYVHQARIEYGEPDVIQVRKVFDDSKKARQWEEKVLNRMRVVEDTRFVNRGNSGKNFCNVGGYTLPSRSLEHCEKISKAKKGKSCLSLLERKKRSQMYKGKGNPNFGRSLNDGDRQKLKEAQKGRAVVVCGHEFKYHTDVALLYNITAAAVGYRVKSRSEKWQSWYYVDTGALPAIKSKIKRPDVSLRNKTLEARERSRRNAIERAST